MVDFTQRETTKVNPLELGYPGARSVSVTIAAGAAHVAGEVLGRVTASGKFILSAAAAGDGSGDPLAVLSHDVDASGADADATVWVCGEFNPALLTYGAGHTAATVRAAFIGKPLFLPTVTEN